LFGHAGRKIVDFVVRIVDQTKNTRIKIGRGKPK